MESTKAEKAFSAVVTIPDGTSFAFNSRGLAIANAKCVPGGGWSGEATELSPPTYREIRKILREARAIGLTISTLHLRADGSTREHFYRPEHPIGYSCNPVDAYKRWARNPDRAPYGAYFRVWHARAARPLPFVEREVRSVRNAPISGDIRAEIEAVKRGLLN